MSRLGPRPFAIAAAILLGLVGPAAPVFAQPGGPAKVSVAPAEERIFHPVVESLGRIEAVRDTSLSSEIGGLVAEVLADEGDRVEAGQVIARFDTSIREIRKRRAEAELALANEQLAEYRKGSREEEIREAKAMLEDAIALLAEAKLDRERLEALRGDAVSDDEISSARAIETSRDAIRRQREAFLDRLEEGPRPEVIARAQAQVEVRTAALAEIEDELRKAEIRAPFEGVITQKAVEVGGFLRPGDALFSLVQMDPVWAVLSVSESALPDLRIGQSVRIELTASSRIGYDGKVDAVIPRGDPVARTFPTKVAVRNEDGRFFPGMGVRGKISTVTERAILAVPLDAVVESPVGPVIFAIREGKAERVPVRTGATERGFVAIEGEITKGEAVVVLGNETLRPGSPVVIVPRAVGVPVPSTGGAPGGGGREGGAREGGAREGRSRPGVEGSR